MEEAGRAVALWTTARRWAFAALAAQLAWLLVLANLGELPERSLLYAQGAAWAFGIAAAWTCARAGGAGRLASGLLCLLQLIPVINALYTVALAIGSSVKRREAITNVERSEIETALRTVAAPMRGERPASMDREMMTAALSAAYALRKLQMHADPSLAPLKPEEAEALVRPYATHDFGRAKDPACLSVLYPEDLAASMAAALTKRFPPGVIAFAGTSNWLGDENHPGRREIVIARAKSQFDIPLIARTNPINDGLDAEKVVERLRQYDAQHGIRITGAESDSISFELLKLPADPGSLAADLAQFCPDLMEGFGSQKELAEAIVKDRGAIHLWWD